MSERSSKGTKTLEEWLFDGSDSDSEDDLRKPRFSFSEVARHDSQTSSSVLLDSVRPVPNLPPSEASGYEGTAELSEASTNASRYSAMSNRSSNPAKKVRRMGSVLMSPPSDMYSRTDMLPRRTYTFKRRTQLTPENDRRDKKRKTQLSPEGIGEVASSPCCSWHCLSSIPVATYLHIRERHLPRSQAHVNEVLMDIITRAYNTKSKVGKKYIYTLESGHEVCAEACAKVFGRSLSHFRALARKVAEGSVSTFRKPRSCKVNTWDNVFLPWLEQYAERYGQKMPNKEGVIELCVGNKKQLIAKFLVYAENMPDFGPPPNTSTLYALWPAHLIVPKRNSFSKCTICENFKTDLEKISSVNQRMKIVQAFDAHLDAQMAERQRYYANRHHARMYPEEAVSVILDGMTQYTTQLPYFVRGAPKNISGARYGLHVFGALVHGLTPRVLVHDPGLTTGPNLAIEALWCILHKYERDQLPPLLYVQLDNTASDNKNHHVLEFCSFLVENGYFEEVHILTSKHFYTHFAFVGSNWIYDGWPYT